MANDFQVYFEKYFFILPLIIFLSYAAYLLASDILKTRSRLQSNQVSLPPGAYPQQTATTGFNNTMQTETNLINTNATVFQPHNTNCELAYLYHILLRYYLLVQTTPTATLHLLTQPRPRGDLLLI